MSCRVLHCADPKAHWVIDVDTGGPANSRTRLSTAVCQRHYRELTSGVVEWGWRLDPDGGGPPAGVDVVLMGEDLRHLNEWVVEDVVTVQRPDQRAVSAPLGRTWTVAFRARRRGDRETDDLRLVLTREQWQRLVQGFEPDP